jgi:hypothetical protein
LSFFLPYTIALHKSPVFPPLTLRFIPGINSTITTIRSLVVPGCILIVLFANNTFLPHVIDKEEVGPRMLEAYGMSVMISYVAHTSAPICNLVVRVFEYSVAKNADSFRRRKMTQEVGGSVGNVRIDLSRMET